MGSLILGLIERLGAWGVSDVAKRLRERAETADEAWRKLAAGEDLAHEEALAIARGSQRLGLGKAAIAFLVLAPLASPWLETVGVAGAGAAGRQVVSMLTDEEGAMDYAHVALAVAFAAFGLRRT